MKMTWSAFRSLSTLCVATAATACSGGDKTTQPQINSAASITVVSGTAQSAQAGEKVTNPLTVKVTDKNGTGVPNTVVSFAISSGGGSLSQTVDTTDSQGVAAVTWTVGPTLGTGRVSARVTGVSAPALFDITIGAGPPIEALRVSSLVGSAAANFDLADSVAVKIGDRFGNPVANTTVSFSVIAGGGKVSPATKTTDDAGVARAAWTMGASGTQTLRASAGTVETSISGVAQTCPENSLTVGQSVTIAVGAANCLIMAGTAQRYIVTVTNPTNSPKSTAAFRLRGAGSTTSSNTTTEPATATSSRNLAVQYAADLLRERRGQQAAHQTAMNASYSLLRRMAGVQVHRNANIVAQTQPPAVGDIVPLKIPKNLEGDACDASTTANPDRGAAAIGGRVIAVTAHAVLLEDTMVPRRGALDTLYTRVGTEFENVMWPILTTNFGNPLAMDAQLASGGKVYMIFSKVVNDMLGGRLAGFVSSGDFAPVALCAASNMRATFYARVPTSTGTGFDQDFASDTPEEWYHSIRTVIIHETKHVASFAERYARNISYTLPFIDKDQWLEEGSAMLAEELWARTVFGYSKGSNVTYENSIYCEVRPRPDARWPQCQPSKPSSMIEHFFYLYNYEVNPESHSIVGPVDDLDASFYGAGWMFLRWVIDNYSTSESGFLNAITTEVSAPGTENIQLRTGKSFADLLGEFSLALALDDLPGFTPANSKLSIPSWNTRNIFAGLAADYSGTEYFSKPVPIKLQPASFGKFIIDVSSVRGGGMSLMDVTGTQTAKQLFEFKGTAGSDFPAELRVNVVRIQ